MKYFEMDRNEFNARMVDMTVKELQALVKVLGFEIKGAWKMKKVELAQAIFVQWEAKMVETKDIEITTTVEETPTEIIEAETNEMPLETAITEQPKKKSRKLVGQIVIYNPKGEVAYTFDSYEKAMIELQVFNLSEIKWLCNGSRIGKYGPRSKFHKFNGYKFTIDK